jgi:DNA-binding NtrC family response regulator
MPNEKILLVDDEDANLRLLTQWLVPLGYDIELASNGEEAVRKARAGRPDLIILDIMMPVMDGYEACGILKADPETKNIPIIMVTALHDRESRLKSLSVSANDFLSKPVDQTELTVRVKNLLMIKAYEDFMLNHNLPERFSFQSIITTSPVMKKALKLAVRVTASPQTTVIIYGESGCGKEVLSRAIHFAGGGMLGGFVAVNCAAIPEALLESELFGHVRGAFTGADREREGKFSQARRGTLLLDEIGDMPLGLQAKLLRVLEGRTFEKVGSNEPIPVDCRVIVATNRNLPEMIAAGRFREDLFHRINVYPITIPPLRERPEDIPLLVDHFLGTFRKHQGKQLPGISQQALDELLAYRWPGNVRELRNCLERATIVCDGLIQPEHLYISHSNITANIEADPPAGGAIDYHFAFSPDMVSMDAVTHRVLDITLEWCKGNKSKAAALLKVSRNSFYR